MIGAEHIVALDSLDGLLRVARQLGRWLQADPDFWCPDVSTGIAGGFAALEREALVDPDVRSHLAGIHKRQRLRSTSKRFDATAYSAADIVAHVNQDPKDPCHWFIAWGMQATPEERETLLAALLASDIPRFDVGLIKWLWHPDEQVRSAALKAVMRLQHSALRQATLQWIAEGNMADGLQLRVNNFEPGDFALCAMHLEPLNDPDHRLVSRLLDLCNAHPGADALDCLLYVYALSPCSTCRKQAVRAARRVPVRRRSGYTVADVNGRRPRRDVTTARESRTRPLCS